MRFPKRDMSIEHPIPEVWKKPLEQVVIAMSNDDFELSNCVLNARLQSDDIAQLNRSNVLGYGCSLEPLSEEVWETSRYQWMGEYWEVIVDLCTKEEGVSDLALSCRIFSVENDFRYEIGLVYVP
ncbi:hypothetical protein BTA51_14880 [Hahella sp. CCB-MM4]|uniref:DUF7668 domain-containing protein n=1 Tax=Hahella sp. (strain CCB-MM4) TaxID=1926491 RepID=UPI000B9C4AD0|nr:hypothetical protein [Hahella sp. CCB-MM4]OZG72413.1 hypothetical protein BTA51_14880 [Hahella sp. CCB-MM4]